MRVALRVDFSLRGTRHIGCANVSSAGESFRLTLGRALAAGEDAPLNSAVADQRSEPVQVAAR